MVSEVTAGPGRARAAQRRGPRPPPLAPSSSSTHAGSPRRRDGQPGEAVPASACSAAPASRSPPACSARRAMEPIAELTGGPRGRAHARPVQRIPVSAADDEVAELAERSTRCSRRSPSPAPRPRRCSPPAQFVADASHELRTPLTSVMANLELLADVLDGDARDAAALGAAVVPAHAPARRRPAAARARRCGRPPRPRPFDMRHVVIDAAAELEPVADDHELVRARGLRGSMGPRRPAPAGLNLIENAISHTPTGHARPGRVERANGEVVLSVTDDGPGIAPTARAGLRALLPRRGRPRRLVRPRPVDRPRRGRPPGPLGDARAAGGRGARFVVALPEMATPTARGHAGARDRRSPGPRGRSRSVCSDDRRPDPQRPGPIPGPRGTEPAATRCATRSTSPGWPIGSATTATGSPSTTAGRCSPAPSPEALIGPIASATERHPGRQRRRDAPPLQPAEGRRDVLDPRRPLSRAHRPRDRPRRRAPTR